MKTNRPTKRGKAKKEPDEMSELRKLLEQDRIPEHNMVRLKAELKMRGISMRILASRVSRFHDGPSVHYSYQIRNGYARPRRAWVLAVAQELGVDPTAILGPLDA